MTDFGDIETGTDKIDDIKTCPGQRFIHRQNAAGFTLRQTVFFRIVTQNIKTFLLPWIGVLGLGVALLFDAYLLFTKPAASVLLFAAVLMLLVVLYAMILSHISLIHAKFECRFRFMISNSVLLSLAHPLRTLALLILELLPLALFLFWPEAFVFMTPVWLLCYFSLRSYAAVWIMEPVYAKLLAR